VQGRIHVRIRQGSQIDDDVANWLRATNEKVAVRGLVEWLGFIGDNPRNQTALTGVTNTRTAAWLLMKDLSYAPFRRTWKTARSLVLNHIIRNHALELRPQF
jgi:hypothetical protein